MREDHWQEKSKGQPNSICNISYANTTDESATIKGDKCWSNIDVLLM